MKGSALPVASPAARGFSTARELPGIGRARRFACVAAEAEIWRLPEGSAELAERLLSLGSEAVGGFFDAGGDDDGVWLARRVASGTLAGELARRRGPWPWRGALALVVPLARAQATAEDASLFAGPLVPDAIALAHDHAWIAADALVGAMVGGRGTARALASAGALAWLPPEAIERSAWDNAANRYALGLIAYRLIGGEHAFAGAGLRHALSDAERGAPPFREEVARGLPQGLQSACLRLIAPARSDRPACAAEIAELLEPFLAPRPSTEASLATKEASTAKKEPSTARKEASAVRKEASAVRKEASAARKEASAVRKEASAVRKEAWSWASFCAGSAALLSVIAFWMTHPAPSLARITPAAARPIGPSATASADCAGCHPREVAEWRDSVMASAATSPLFNALELLVEEQVGRDRDCSEGAGILRRRGADDCRDPHSGLAITGSGGEQWCVNCHAPGENIAPKMRPWSDRDRGARLPVEDSVAAAAREGISCVFCHEAHGPAPARGGYVGNARWTSFASGAVFDFRPEDARGLFGIGNSGYRLDPDELLVQGGRPRAGAALSGGFSVHERPSPGARRYLGSSEMCGACHDVRLFGTDALGKVRGEHFKRLRNAYSEWLDYAAVERRAGRPAASCQDCHMSLFPGACLPGADGERADESTDEDDSCPAGTHFEPRAPGTRARGYPAAGSSAVAPVASHRFASVDLPLTPEVDAAALDRAGLDQDGVPESAKRRRDMLLRAAVSLSIGAAKSVAGRLDIPIVVANVGAGHKIPAGFSQERELWLHLRVTDGEGALVYEVGRVDRDDEDLRDKIFDRIEADPDRLDGAGRPAGLFGADVKDGPDVPQWSPSQASGADHFVGLGLINFQNGFLRCVRCLGEIDASGRCAPDPSGLRGAAFADGGYDPDTGACRSNLSLGRELFETYFPVGALDADRGLPKAPDAILDTRALSPGRPVTFEYRLDVGRRRGPFAVTAELWFRAFPPYLVRAFADYEAHQAAAGRRPGGALVSVAMLRRIERVLLRRRRALID